MTDEQFQAKKCEMLESAKALNAQLRSLDNELHEFARSWSTLARTLPGLNIRSVQIGENELTSLNISRSMQPIALVLWKHFDAEAIKRLLGDIQRTSEALNQAEGGLRVLGI